MQRALALARQGEGQGEVPVGAVVVAGGRVIAAAHNECARRSDPTAHAELLAIHDALRVLGTARLLEATLYVTLEPCAQCAGAIVLSKVGRVVYGADDPKAGMAGSVADLLRHPALNHRPEVVAGVLADESGALLKAFFETKRRGSV